MTNQIDHPVLGLITRNAWAWTLTQTMALPCTGFTPREITIVVFGGDGAQPSQDQLQALIDLIQAPSSFQEVIAQAVLAAYIAEIRPEYAECLSDTRHNYGMTIDDLPQARDADDVWKFVSELRYVYVNEDATINLGYIVTFDPEHQLQVLINGTRIERVWME